MEDHAEMKNIVCVVKCPATLQNSSEPLFMEFQAKTRATKNILEKTPLKNMKPVYLIS